MLFLLLDRKELRGFIFFCKYPVFQHFLDKNKFWCSVKLDSLSDFWTGFPRLCFCSWILWGIEQIVASALSGQQKRDQNYPEWIGTRPSQLPQPWMATRCTGMTIFFKPDIEYTIYFRFMSWGLLYSLPS